MGFWDINHWVESDGAADFRCGLIQALEKPTEAKRTKALRAEVSKELRDMANGYNTPGYLNLALCLEVEGKDKGYDEELPVFSQRLTVAQLRKADDLFKKHKGDWEPHWHDRLDELHVVVRRLVVKRTKK